MAPPLFSEYIQTLKKQAGQARLMVVGNQGADLDSIASALVLAWHLTSQRPDKTAIPLVAIPRRELRLRPEVLFVLAQAAIPADALLFLDDLELAPLLVPGAEVILVDHNRAESGLRDLAPRVTAIIDHHHDAGDFPGAAPRIVEPVGSTATLVAELIVMEGGELDAVAALLLASAILMDTVNLSPEAGRSTTRDQNMAAKLLGLCGRDQASLFNTLHLAQHDLSDLSSTELLRRDYKEWSCPTGRYGMSTVLLSLTTWQQRGEKLATAVSSFALSQKLNTLVVMLASQGQVFSRQLILFCQDKERLTALTTFLTTQNLQLTALAGDGVVGGSGGFVAMYHQGNTAISRKKLQPLIHRFLAGRDSL